MLCFRNSFSLIHSLNWCRKLVQVINKPILWHYNQFLSHCYIWMWTVRMLLQVNLMRNYWFVYFPLVLNSINLSSSKTVRHVLACIQNEEVKTFLNSDKWKWQIHTTQLYRFANVICIILTSSHKIGYIWDKRAKGRGLIGENNHFTTGTQLCQFFFFFFFFFHWGER